MADELTEEERRLIDEAVSRGNVRQIARGESAWMEIEGVSIGPTMNARLRRHKLAMIERRKAVRQMLRDGATKRQIVAALREVGPTTVKRDIIFVRGAEKPVGGPSTPGRVSDTKEPRNERERTAQRRRERISKLVEQGLTRAEIVRRLQIGSTTLSNDLNRLGLRTTIATRWIAEKKERDDEQHDGTDDPA